jgi:hypothetical protein
LNARARWIRSNSQIIEPSVLNASLRFANHRSEAGVFLLWWFSMHEGILISYGGAIKSLEVKGDLVTVGDYGLLWGSEDRHDLVGDYYTPQTFLGARGGLGVDTLLHHGIPLSHGLKSYSDILLPPTIKAEPDEHGLLVATILDRRDAYQRKMYELSEEGALSWSSGAISRAVKRRDGVKCGEVTQWPIQEFSFTPTPCEPRMIGITTLDEVKTAPLDWFKEPSYAKAVRVLTDLKGGSKSTGAALARGEEVKSILFGTPWRRKARRRSQSAAQ